jgi:tetratricopeptide (TPR) repeat protein
LIKRFLFFCGILLVVHSCEKTQDTKGETIPPQFIFQKTQKPEIIVAYLSKLLESQDGANLYYLRAKAYFDMRAYLKAQFDIEQALKKIPGDVDFLLLSSQIKGQLGLIPEAIEDAKLVESSGLSAAKLFLVLADLHLLNHEKRLGYSYILKVQQVGIPKSEEVYCKFLSRIFRSDSLGALQSISNNNRQHPDLSHAYYFYQIGHLSDIAYQKSILAELKKYPMDPYLMWAWGNFLVHVDQNKQAEKVYKQVVAWLPQHPKVRLQLARFYIDRKQYDSANKQLDIIGPNSVEIKEALYLRALLQMNAGQKSKSIALLDSVRKIYTKDARFNALYDRIVGKKVDSVSVKKDSTQQNTP